MKGSISENSTFEQNLNSNDTKQGMIDKMVNSSIFLFQPWFMSVLVFILLTIVVVTLLYTILCRSKERKNSREAIISLSEDQIISEEKISNKKPCVIVTICLSLIVFTVGLYYLIYHMRSTGETFAVLCSRAWDFMSATVKQPWFFSLIFGVLLIGVILFSIHSILKDGNVQKSKHRTNRRTKKGLSSQPWFIAFICALVMIVVLSVALFAVIFQKSGDDFMDAVTRFFFMEPWFFGIVVGVVLVTLVVFNLYRILKGNGENYAVNENDQLTHTGKSLQESQGFDEYPSKNINAQTQMNQEQEKTVVVPTVITSQKTEPYQMSNVNTQNIMPASLSLQINEGQFYDEKQFHEEDDSMAEYGLGENDQFNDEGSFIGLYNRDRIQNYMAQFNKNNLN